ncbi:MAG: hypothetical protein JZU70_09805, partial [Chlorobium sp.]|nr:hypothetical protein [Chlorobium sp.]
MANLFELKKSAFVLWSPNHITSVPKLVIGLFEPGNPTRLVKVKKFKLKQHTAHPDLWSIDAAKCKLRNGQVYHYWFEVSDSSPTRDGSRIYCTDPAAFTVDWRLLAQQLPAPH